MKKMGILFGIIAILVLVMSCVNVENTKKPFETKANTTITPSSTGATQNTI